MPTNAPKKESPPIKTEKDLLRECRKYVENAHWIAELEYDNPESDHYMDGRVYDAIQTSFALLEEIDYVLATKH